MHNYSYSMFGKNVAVTYKSKKLDDRGNKFSDSISRITNDDGSTFSIARHVHYSNSVFEQFDPVTGKQVPNERSIKRDAEWKQQLAERKARSTKEPDWTAEELAALERLKA